MLTSIICFEEVLLSFFCIWKNVTAGGLLDIDSCGGIEAAVVLVKVFLDVSEHVGVLLHWFTDIAIYMYFGGRI